MSKYKWRDLIKLRSKNDSYESPLSVLCHIDVNCFYAQVEAVRCGYTKDDPVVCVQWNSIVAVSYAARKYGITRMNTIQQALKKTDDLIPIHTAVFRKGEDFWQYHDGWGPWNEDKEKQLPSSIYKISLDPYRRESRKIFKIFTEYCDLAEKASVDEVFLDIARLCLQKLMGSEQVLPGKENHNTVQMMQEMFKDETYDPDEFLPPVPEELKEELKFVGNVFNPNNESLIEDWDDVLFAIGSQIAQELRDEIKHNLGYTTSCGLARTKIVCKLASNFKKPDAQTIIKNDCIHAFLDNGKFEITSFWSLGGLLGKELIQILKLPEDGTIKSIRDEWPKKDDLRICLNKSAREFAGRGNTNRVIDVSRTNEVADKLYDAVRGQHRLPVVPQTMVKSLMSNKNMTGQACNSLGDCFSWLEVFAGELAGRVHELQQEYNKIIIPRTVHVLIRAKSGEAHSKSCQFVQQNGKLSSHDLLKAGAKLTAELDARYARGKEYAFYPLQNINMSISNLDVVSSKKSVMEMFGGQAITQKAKTLLLPKDELPKDELPKDELPKGEMNETRDDYTCKYCNLNFGNPRDFQEHADFHIAMSLSEKINGSSDGSASLSLGERRLLDSKRKSTTPELPSKRKPKKKKNDRGSSSDIMKYFAKG